ncbi:MAG: Gfo/Idh/MocA family protein, partial [Bythopirellula sp.]
MKPVTTRREFITRGGDAVAATAALAALGSVHSMAAEQVAQLRLGIIGCGGMMNGHIQGLIDRKSAVSFGWLCDVDPKQIDKTTRRLDGFQSVPPQHTARYEDVVADKNVDVVIIATPHHWHAPIALAAIAEGKDVYIEKPISHSYDEGPAVVAAAEKYGRVVQHGS